VPPHAEILTLLTTYGYVAVFLGAMFEGEVVVILSGLFAQQGYLSFCLVILLVQIAATLNDGMWFLIGRYRVPRKLYASAWFQRMSLRPMGLVNERPEMLALFMRFMYGFRSLIPLGLGLSKISPPRFFIFHAIGTFAWAMSLASIGYFFGGMLETLFGRIKYPELVMVSVVIVMVTLFFSFSKLVKRYLGRKLNEEESGDTEEK
jgi:membrane protein DedA with SNARE-associated domain